MYIDHNSPSYANKLALHEGRLYHEIMFEWKGQKFTVRVAAEMPSHLVPIMAVEEALGAIAAWEKGLATKVKSDVF